LSVVALAVCTLAYPMVRVPAWAPKPSGRAPDYACSGRLLRGRQVAAFVLPFMKPCLVRKVLVVEPAMTVAPQRHSKGGAAQNGKQHRPAHIRIHDLSLQQCCDACSVIEWAPGVRAVAHIGGRKVCNVD